MRFQVTHLKGSKFARHREIRHSKDLHMIEFVAPAKFRTYSVEKPAARKSPARR